MSASLSEIIETVNQVVASYWPLQAFIATNPLWDMTDQSFDKVCQRLSGHMTLCMDSAFYRQAYYNDDITDDDLVCALKRLGLNDTDWLEAIHDYIKQDEQPQTPAILLCEQIESFNYQPALQWIQQRVNFWLLQYFGELSQDTSSSRRPSSSFPYSCSSFPGSPSSFPGSPSSFPRRRESSNHNHDNDLLSLFTYWQHYIIREHNELAVLTKFSDPLATLEFLIHQLGIDQQVLSHYLTRIVCHQYGWASLIKWLHQRPDNPWLPPTADLATVLCMWLSYEWLICHRRSIAYQPVTDEDGTAAESVRAAQLAAIWQLAYDNHQHQQLINQLTSVKSHTREDKPDAQLIFCMDVRSEAIRRHIEALGHYETYGFAGFFGFAFKLADECGYSYKCPALLDPEDIVTIQSKHKALVEQADTALSNAVNRVKDHITSPYALFEMVGIYKIIKLIKKTFLNQHPADKPVYSMDTLNTQHLSTETAAQAAYQLLTTIGLTQGFADDVIICAHQSTNENNPFAAALDCGACGGNSGIPNALVAAHYLNQSEVRQRLADRGIQIPEATTFIAGCHYTTHDEIELFDTPSNTKIPDALERACVRLRAEKSGHFVYHENNQLMKKQNDWAELVPELGLANNQALVIGPRHYTQSLNLNGRVFLHSYEPRLDEDGSILANIVAAPVIVAHWINAQYYFSTVSNEQLGAGNKAIHNVIPNIGVMEGNLSDLKIGLPQQSVMYKNQLIHQPVRLLLVIYGKRALIEQVIDSNPTVKQLIDGLWISLKIIEV